jgi:hypothetical protein
MAKKLTKNVPEIIDVEHDVVPFEDGMTLMPGQTAEINVNVTILTEEIIEDDDDGIQLQGHDISYAMFGRYTNCTLDKASGLWYADADIAWSGVRPGAMPSPEQDTPELTRKALDIWAASDTTPPAGFHKEIEAARASYVAPPPKTLTQRIMTAIFGVQ